MAPQHTRLRHDYVIYLFVIRHTQCIYCLACKRVERGGRLTTPFSKPWVPIIFFHEDMAGNAVCVCLGFGADW